MNSKTNIHFICRGNIYRSRLAEAYAKSVLGDTYHITSSGLKGDLYPGGYISNWAKILSKKYNLDQFLSKGARQTTNQLLKSGNLLIFMSDDVYQEAKLQYEFDQQKCIIWNVKDRRDYPNNVKLTDRRERSFKVIRRQVNKLAKMLNGCEWVDVVDDKNNLLNFSLPIRLINQNKVWHRGCHAIITNSENETLVQKRSSNIIFSPSLIDITLGGHVSANEQPADAALREIEEEVGISLKPSDLHELGISKQSAYHPRYKINTKVFLYTYHAKLDSRNPPISVQKEEVEFAKFISKAQLKRLLSRGYLRKFGKLNYTREYYKRICRSIGLID